MLEWTGERYLPFLDPSLCGSDIHYEHLHRYAFASQFVEAKKVLDLASGEGYGSFLLSEKANCVVGVDIDQNAIKHSSKKYHKENLQFLQGSICEIPLKGNKIFDVIVCFEAIEHIEEQEKLMAEIKRLIKDDGILIISTPDKRTYTDDAHYSNPFHLKELYLDDFDSLLKKHFKNNLILGQKIYPGSEIWLIDDRMNSCNHYEFLIEQTEKGFEFTTRKKEPLYYIAIASDINLNKIETLNSHLLDLSSTIITYANARAEKYRLDVINRDSKITDLAQQSEHLEKELNETKLEKNKTIENLSILEKELNKTIENLSILEKELNKTKLEKNKTIENLSILEKELNETKLEKNKAIENVSILEKELNEMKQSISWQLTSKYQKIFVDRLLPHNTRRRAFYDMNLRGGRILFNEGFGSFWKSLKARIKKHLPFIIIKYIDYIFYKLHILKSTSLAILAKKNTIKHKNPEIDIIIPVYNNAQYLRECINSAVNQSYQNTHVTIVDDKSTDPTVYNILDEFKNNPRVNVYYHDINMGISATTNDAIIHSKGDYVAFLDCDDVLLPESIEKVATLVLNNSDVEFIYTDRININSAGDVIEHISFKNRGTDAKNELLIGMYTSHLKLIKRDSFLKTGLFSSRYDSAQDYDIALRMSEHVQFGYVNEFLYKHRVHERQTTTVALMQQEHLAEQIKQEAIKRRALYGGITNKLTSIVILTLNRVEDTKRSIDALYANTSLLFELIILDNGSTDPNMKEYLEELGKSKSNVTILFEEKNLGCSGGRRKATSYTKGDYIVTLDNDICVTPCWLENFIMRIEADEKIAAACAKVVFPDGKVQYNGGSMEIKGDFVSFSLIDSNKNHLDFSTLIERDCDWIPGGAMIIKRKYREMVSHRMEMQGSYEDNDYALQLKKIGVKLVNCPLTEVIHYHLGFGINTMNDKKYLSERYNKERLMNSLIAFYKFNQLIIKDEELFKMLGLANKTDDEIINLIKKRVEACIDENPSENKPLCSSEELFCPEIVSH